MAVLLRISVFLLLGVCVVWGTDCQEPHNRTAILEDLYAKIYNYDLTDASFFVIPEYRESRERTHSGSLEPEQSEQRLGERRKFAMPNAVSRRCRHAGRTSGSGESTCPHFTVLEFDALRIPEILAKAECSCRRCSYPKGNRCKLISSYVPVIRKYCKNGTYRYWVDVESVGVGCTCVHNISVPSS